MATRLRSPRYPSMSLEDAISHGRTIFDKDRRHPIAREVAAAHIGYKSLNGAADSALSSLMQFGILEKVAREKFEFLSGLWIFCTLTVRPNEFRQFEALPQTLCFSKRWMTASVMQYHLTKPCDLT